MALKVTWKSVLESHYTLLAAIFNVLKCMKCTYTLLLVYFNAAHTGSPASIHLFDLGIEPTLYIQ